MVPLSDYAVLTLMQITYVLAITPEAWLQGVLGNLARKAEKRIEQYEMALRNQHRRKR